ncbi:hypothetical protein HaLaN_23049 [Haematococcus lacustris]|uniref:Uncharacterized protein n=1 Tax=Haematococcus lacustris TaxID=44745 RepID=A0A699ZT79_HAELA|nr:hypothetical protein HaLaN_23049 [Haematococcus lacustris]
MPDAQKLA